jgi:alpha-tubulin suppressor-like RCC1 family protein
MKHSLNRINLRTISVVLLFLISLVSASAQVYAWGANWDGQTNIPDSLSDKTVTAIAGGDGHSLALTSEGKVVAWGANWAGQTNIPDSLSGKTVTAIAAGYYHSLALTSEGKVVAWGYDPYGESSIPDSLTGKTVTAIAAGQQHSLALTSEGKVVAWGQDWYGQNTIPNSLTNKSVTAIADSGSVCLAVTSEGKVVAWGRDYYGQTEIPSSLTGKIVTAISASNVHCLALTSEGKVVAWGSNGAGECNVPASLDNKTVVKIAAGGTYTYTYDMETDNYMEEDLRISMAITSDGEVVAWGSNYYGQTEIPSSLTGKNVTEISGGVYHALALVSPKKPAPAPAFTINETSGSFTGGKAATVTGTVTFAKAVNADTTVTLSSSNSAVTVPATVTVNSGATSATFTITSSRVASLTSVKLTATTTGYENATNEFSVKPQLVAVTASPSSFEGGTTGTGKVTLSVASATDTVVSLSSNDSHVNFNGATVTIPANQSSATFNIPSTTVTAATNVEISATPGISTLTSKGTITLKPVPTIDSFTASRSTVYGNQKTTFTITLASKPGPNGTTVTLDTTGSTGLINVPTSLTFAAGVTKRTFEVYVSEDAADGSVLITATSGTTAVGKTITLKKLKLSGTTLDYTNVIWGTHIHCTVKLNAAVDRDTTVSVSSSDSSVASTPQSVTIPAGGYMYVYEFETYQVTKKKSVTISATKGGYTSNKSLTVTP